MFHLVLDKAKEELELYIVGKVGFFLINLYAKLSTVVISLSNRFTYVSI